MKTLKKILGLLGEIPAQWIRKMPLFMVLFIAINAHAQLSGIMIQNLPIVSQFNSYDIMIKQDSGSSDTSTHQCTVKQFITGYNLATNDTLLDLKDSTPVTGNTIQTTGYKHLEIYGTITLTTLTINLPQAKRSGQELTICSKVAITTLTLSGGTTITSYTTLAAGGVIRLKWDALHTLWYNN